MQGDRDGAAGGGAGGDSVARIIGCDAEGWLKADCDRLANESPELNDIEVVGVGGRESKSREARQSPNPPRHGEGNRRSRWRGRGRSEYFNFRTDACWKLP